VIPLLPSEICQRFSSHDAATPRGTQLGPLAGVGVFFEAPWAHRLASSVSTVVLEQAHDWRRRYARHRQSLGTCEELLSCRFSVIFSQRSLSPHRVFTSTARPRPDFCVPFPTHEDAAPHLALCQSGDSHSPLGFFRTWADYPHVPARRLSYQDQSDTVRLFTFPFPFPPRVRRSAV